MPSTRSTAEDAGWLRDRPALVRLEPRGLPADELIRALQDGGIEARPELTIKVIGANNGLSPMAVYDAIREAAEALSAKTP